MNRIHLNWQDLEKAGYSILMQMFRDQWYPERIVGITAGGLPLAVWISNQSSVPMVALGNETNAWLSEDAFGYNDQDPMRTLIVNDVNNTGATFRWIMQDWQNSCLPSDPRWDDIWGNSVRFATLVENVNCNFDLVNYSHIRFSGQETPNWYVFPWEQNNLNT